MNASKKTLRVRKSHLALWCISVNFKYINFSFFVIFLNKYRIIFTLSLLQSEPICAIGHGVAGLCSARREDGKSWSFKSFSMTGVSTGSVWYFQYIIITPLRLHLGWFRTSRTWHRLVDQLMKLWTLLNLFLGQYWKNAKRKGKKKESQRGEV